MAHLTQEYVQHLYETYGDLKVLDDIVRHRSRDDPPRPILGYPISEHTVNEYELFTGKKLDLFVENAARNLLDTGLRNKPRGSVVGILATSNVDFVVTLFALSRLGFAVLCLSLRITPKAIVNLLRQTECTTIIHGQTAAILSTIENVKREANVDGIAIPLRDEYDTDVSDSLRDQGPAPRESVSVCENGDREAERDRLALVMHSSGSTGLPKPVFLTHRNVLTHAVQGSGLDNFASLPLYHMYGVSTTLQAMYLGRTANLFNANLPLTADNLIGSIEAVQPQVIHAVPYALGLLAEKPRGVELLKQCRLVTAAGARTPDELGDRLVKAGVNLGVVFGTTEAGLAGDTMRRPKGDDSWNYIRFYANIRKYVHMDPIDDGPNHQLFECVYLKGHPGLSVSNSDDPAPGSWHSKDVFTPHPTISDVWKYVTRIDDRITLVNGEKVLPLPIEGRIRQHELVREAVVFGVDRAIPGLLLFSTLDPDELADSDDFLNAIWPTVEEANRDAEAFSQIGRDMVCVLPSNVNYPRTDKGSIIRAQVYQEFEQLIQDTYDRLEGKVQADGPRLDLGLKELEEFISDMYRRVMGVPLSSLDVDFFEMGVDSLKAIQMRLVIHKNLNLGGAQLSANVVYECRNARALARHLFALAQGDKVNGISHQPSPSSLMESLIAKYSSFGDTVILTGATGSLGSHVLAQLVRSKDVRRIYCFVRGENPAKRIQNALRQRHLEVDPLFADKIEAVTADPGQVNFGLSPTTFLQLKREVTLILHIAWPVNFNISLESFEPHLLGLHNLLQLSLDQRESAAGSSRKPMRLFFCSSVGVAHQWPADHHNMLVPESAINDFSYAGDTGYARSKLVGEHMVKAAAQAGARSYVLRTGQIVGDTEFGIWNDNEFVPTMVHSALSLRTMPDLQEECSWIPVDVAATSILQLARTAAEAPKPYDIDACDPPIFYNLVNPSVFSWSSFLDELRAAGLVFDTVSPIDWLETLKAHASKGEDSLPHSDSQVPAIKLIDYFASQYGQSGKRRDPTFGTDNLVRDSPIMRDPPQIIGNKHVAKFLSRWMEIWSR